MSPEPHFTRATLRFLRDLAANNDRAWFADNKARYEAEVKAPALRFIQAFGSELGRISPHFLATPRSLFRIHRDTRFSKDKSPYKTYTGIQFRHEQSRDVHAPGYYLHIEPGQIFAGLGIWHPASESLRAIRERIVEEPAAWKRASRGKKLRETLELAGDRLKRSPRGFDPDHPMADDLRWKDFIAVRSVPDRYLTEPDLPRRFAKLYRAGTPYMRFLCDAMGVPF